MALRAMVQVKEALSNIIIIIVIIIIIMFFFTTSFTKTQSSCRLHSRTERVLYPTCLTQPLST